MLVCGLHASEIYCRPIKFYSNVFLNSGILTPFNVNIMSSLLEVSNYLQIENDQVETKNSYSHFRGHTLLEF